MEADRLIEVEDRGPVRLMTLANPPVNALNEAARFALSAALDDAIGAPEVGAVVLVGAGRCFCAGADIREFDGGICDNPPTIGNLVARIEAAPKPMVAAVHGAALGGGFELALGCHFRVGAPDARVGLPEVKLGVIPGAGGTQRLPRIIGLDAAVDIILSGETITAEDALALGVFDRVASASLVDEAVAVAMSAIASGDLPRTRDRAIHVRRSRDAESVIADARQRIGRRARGLVAPWHALDCLMDAATREFEVGIREERRRFIACRESEQSKAQRHLFLAERAAARVQYAYDDAPSRDIRSVGVVGIGMLGLGVVRAFASTGLRVKILEVSPDALERAVAGLRARYQADRASGRMSTAQVEACLRRIVPVPDYAGLADSDLLVESVVEELETKRAVLGLLETVAGPDTVIATTTSNLDFGELLAGLSHPERVVGMHFSHPAEATRLVEVVQTPNRDGAAHGAVVKLVRRLGKVAVQVAATRGYVANRMFETVLRQGCQLLLEGASCQVVDRVAYEFGFPMGPFCVSDIVGLDGAWRVRTGRERDLISALCELGRYGRKTGAGWYSYDAERNMAFPDAEVEALIERHSRAAGLERRPVSDDEILERCLLASINEGARILEARVVKSPADVDLTCVYGFGFPAHRGGPLYYADRLGLAHVVERLERGKTSWAKDVQVSPLLVERAAANGTFHPPV